MVKWMDELPLIVKIIFALPGLDAIFWGIYRIVKGAQENNALILVGGIIWLLVGWPILWIIDLISIALAGRPLVFA